MSVHQLEDGRWFVKYSKGTNKNEPNRTREYFGRGKESERLARVRNSQLGFKENSKTIEFKTRIKRLEQDLSIFSKGVEKEIQEELFFLLKLAEKNKEGVKEQVHTPTGYIDILTIKEIIEIKVLNDWKAGVGQLNCYREAFPDRDLRLHLFERPHAKYYQKASNCTIVKICQSLKTQNIKISFHDKRIYYDMQPLFDNVVPIFSCCQ